MSATKKTDIESLVSAAQGGSGEAINALVHAMRPTVEMIAMKYIHSPLEKDDLVQEGMIGLLAALRAYQPKRGAAFRTFAGTCIENAIQTALRKFSRRKDVPADNMVPLEDYLDHAGTAVSAEDDFLAAESVARLSRALEQQLSPMENEVLRLHISGFRYADIATRLNKSPKAVDNALQRIRKKLTLLFE